MKRTLRAYVFPVLMAGLLMAGCSEGVKGTESDMKKQLDADLGAVEKVTVLSTDGQEVPLALDEFLKELPEQGKDLQVSPQPLKRDEIRYTLVLYRHKLAPLVVEVGKQASQYGENTYRGPGADRFYQWIHREAGKGLLPAAIQTAVVSAEDLGQTVTLGKTQAEFLQGVLAAATPLSDKEIDQYPLYPHYRLRIDTGGRSLHITMLTPTLVSIPFGRETHYYSIQGSLFSQLTQWLPPRRTAGDAFDRLFQASKIRVEPSGDARVASVEQSATETTVEQGKAHQCVRLLKGGVALAGQPKSPGSERYRLIFSVEESEVTVHVYDRHIRFNDNWYAHERLDDELLTLLRAKK
ncbi:hypothetical protein ACT91Q_04805 [Brevibacillus thermoruber]|uniref:hypothetical protein n=1 Tax=Brevibacillus thermoruber TaxID=33942 RepID=UPI00404251C5